jgi:predicted aspartyl protease
MVNGQGPFLFGLDTGLSQPAMVSQTLVERLQLPIVEGFRLSDGSGKNSRNVDGVRIDAVRLGNVSFNQVLALVWGDDPEGEGKPGTYGTIGFELFKDYVVTFDYPGKRLLIATGELPKADGMAVLSYTLDRGTPRVPITLAGLSLEAWIDTGGVGKILLPPSLAEKLPLRTPLRHAGKVATILNEVDLYRSELEGDLRIGNASLHNPILLFAEVLQSPNIGRDALHEFVITFDQRNKRVRFEQSLQENERE